MKGAELKEIRLPHSKEHDATWVGVLPATFAEFLKWLRVIGSGNAFHEWVNRIEAEKPLRFNQGDAFFSEHLGVDTPCTQPGEAESPWLMQSLKEKEE